MLDHKERHFFVLNDDASLCLSDSQTNSKTLGIQKENDIKNVSVLNDDIDASPQNVCSDQKPNKPIPIPIPSIAGVLHVFPTILSENRQILGTLFLKSITF